MRDISVLRKQVKQFVENASEKELRLMYNFFEMNQEGDWWDEIDEDFQKSFDEGIKDADKGKVVPHSEIVKQDRKWLKK